LTGVKAITIHCRTTPERPRDMAHWDVLQEIIASKPINIPIIANGDVFAHEDIAKIRGFTGADSVMIARGAIKNTSIFQSTPIPVYDVMRDYMKLAITSDNHYTNTKYTLLQMAKLHGIWQNNGEGEGQIIHKGKSTRVIASLFKLEEFYDSFQKQCLGKQNQGNIKIASDTSCEDLIDSCTTCDAELEPQQKKQKLEHGHTQL